jgi:iron(III) transport system substrate-binding protein
MRMRNKPIRVAATKKGGAFTVLLVLMALVVASCGGDGATTTTAEPEASPTTEGSVVTTGATETTAGSETETTTGSDEEDPLAELAAAAEAEGGSLEYSFVLGEEYLGPLVNAFRERYPFAEVNITTGGALQLIEKVLSETQTNNPLTDMIQGGPLEDAVLCNDESLCYEYSPQGAAEVPEELRFEGSPFVVPAYFTFHIAYNTEVVSEEEAPTNLADFAEPEWNGRFGIDLEVIDWFAAELAYYGEEEGLELFGRIAANNPVIYSGAQGYEQLAAGSMPASINAYSLLLPEYMGAGAPIAVAQTDHMIALPDEFIGINTTDNPALLELWMEWLFTEEAQNIQPQSLGKTPVVPGIPVPDTLAALSDSCTGDCELFFGTSENFGDFDTRVEQFQELFVSG